ncbi:MAG: phosphate signaling complex protein PhoU [Acidobacteriota bacterium]
MERHVDQDMDRIRQSILKMGARAEEIVAVAIRGLIDRDEVLTESVFEKDKEIDRLEIEIDKDCERIMATQQPTARDMRFLVAAMKINTDLERIGDSAVNIAEAVRVLNELSPLKPYIDISKMSEMAREMLRSSLAAYVDGNTQLAMDVCRTDDEVDALFEQLFRELLTYMIERPDNITRCLQLLFIASNLERVADHATNIGEDVIFMIEGRDIRHLQASSA